MDDMSMIRGALAADSPHPRVVAEGRQRLLRASLLRARRTRTARTARRGAAFALTGALAATAVVATAVLGGGTPPRSGDSATIGRSSHDFLLTAARRAESTSTSGTYWHVRTRLTKTWPAQLGSGDNRYTVEDTAIEEEWTNRDGQTWRGRREWVEPKTSEDEAAWRRDGSPDEWCPENADVSEPFCLRTTPGTAYVTRMEGDAAFLVAEEHELSFDELQQLPQDPNALRDWANRVASDVLDDSASDELFDYSAAGVLVDLLVDVPVRPEVRAAAFRALADMPNVRSTGPTEDALGRHGVGISVEVDGVKAVVADGVAKGKVVDGFTRRLIIDPETSYVLADQGTGDGHDEGTLILDVGWTDEKPHEPARP